jgi:hypothetical protein
VLRSERGARTVGRWADRLVNPLTRRLPPRLIRWLLGVFLAGWGVLRLVHVARAVLLILWGAGTLGEAYGSPIRDNAYRRELDQEVRRLI